jgi:hypothetical protein
MLQLKKLALSLGGALALAAPAYAEEIQGPSSSQTPYITAVAPGVKLISLLTVGDAVANSSGAAYRMVGIPDGLGAFREGKRLVVVMNHELGATAGVPRAHGATGAFVSRWSFDIDSLKAISGEDQIRTVHVWDAILRGYKNSTTTSFARFCSADLPLRAALYNESTRKGYPYRIFMNGEETGAEGRAFAHIVSGPDAGHSYELPSLGKFSWENALAGPTRQDRTVVIGTDDSTPGQVYVYIGEKRASGNPVERAGLHGGKLYGVKVAGLADESRAAPIASTFSLADLGDVTDSTGATLEISSVANGVTRFLRPEDGAWDTLDPNVFYFNTTDRYDQTKDGVGTQVGASRIQRLRFLDIRHPELGGSIETVGDATGPQQMLDNVTVNAEGKLIVLEDVGGNKHNGKVWQFDPATRNFTMLAQHDVARFGDLAIPATAPYTNDEESSGVIEITRLVKGARWFDKSYRYYLLDVQAHYPLGGELVEGGQLLMMAVPGAAKAPNGDDEGDGGNSDIDDGGQGDKDD